MHVSKAIELKRQRKSCFPLYVDNITVYKTRNIHDRLHSDSSVRLINWLLNYWLGNWTVVLVAATRSAWMKMRSYARKTPVERYLVSAFDSAQTTVTRLTSRNAFPAQGSLTASLWIRRRTAVSRLNAFDAWLLLDVYVLRSSLWLIATTIAEIIALCIDRFLSVK